MTNVVERRCAHCKKPLDSNPWEIDSQFCKFCHDYEAFGLNRGESKPTDKYWLALLIVLALVWLLLVGYVGYVALEWFLALLR